MKNKGNDDNNEEHKVSTITAKKRGLVSKKRVPPIIDRKPGIAAAAPALADAEQKPILIKTAAASLIADEQPGIDLKDVGIGKLAGAVPPVVEPEQVPGLAD